MIFQKISILIIIFNVKVFGFSTEDLYANFKHVHPNTSVAKQEIAVKELIARILPSHSNFFDIEINSSFPINSFELIKENNSTTVLIRASNGVSACKGFYHYLKYYLNAHISWSGNQLQTIPKKSDEFPSVRIKSDSASYFIYYQNVCTWSYSFAWWTWSDWRKHIDWMAIMGITLTLAPIQEAIWTKVYKDIGLTDKEINAHFAGPAFQAWQRMGNIRGWAGPLSEGYKSQQLKLQKQIITAQRDLGMTVALPAFAGHVPVAFRRIFPNASLSSVDCWNRFSQEYCCPLFIDPTDPLYHFIGDKFLKEIINEYGTDHIYFSDPFNEIQPRLAEPIYLAKTSSNIYKSMSSVDPNAIWLLQGWMFVKNPFWSDNLLEAFLTAVPKGKLLILDLQSEQSPQYERTNSYYGQPFIWCMLHNFGGTLGMHGSIDIVNKRITESREIENITMVGVGITPEGINQNYVLYEFALERGWSREEFDLDIWLDHYTISRYGIDDYHLKNALHKLRNSVYSYHGLIRLHGKYTICRRPSAKLKPWIWYDSDIIISVWEDMLNANESILNNTLFEHDLVDITRQFLQNQFDKIYVNLMAAYNSMDIKKFDLISHNMMEILLNLELILQTNNEYLLGKWLNSAKAIASNVLEEQLFEINARNQITIWGPNSEINDYANKQWSGIVADYFLPRWKLFLKELRYCLVNNQHFNENVFRQKILNEIEKPFSIDRKIYPNTSIGNSFNISMRIYHNLIKLQNPEILNEKVQLKWENTNFTTTEFAPTVTTVF